MSKIKGGDQPREPREYFPPRLKREVRQRCGFGCVICGEPFYQYEHMEGYAKVRRHRAEEITLLCHKHHGEKTNGLLPPDQVRQANASPFNLKAGLSASFALHFQGTKCEVIAGGVQFTAPMQLSGSRMVPVLVDDTPLFGFITVAGHLLFNLYLMDENDKLLLRILENELVYIPEPWDIEFVGQTLTVREAARKIMLEIRFEPPNRVVIPRARFLHRGIEIMIRPDYVQVGNNGNRLTNMQIEGFHHGLMVGRPRLPHRSVAIHITVDDVDRYYWRKKAKSSDTKDDPLPE